MLRSYTPALRLEWPIKWLVSTVHARENKLTSKQVFEYQPCVMYCQRITFSDALPMQRTDGGVGAQVKPCI
jgi:hypothetical protein